MAIKASLRRPGFAVDATELQRGLLDEGLSELPIALPHIARIAELPWLHRDPVARMLVAQAIVEGLTLLSADSALEGYGRCVRAI